MVSTWMANIGLFAIMVAVALPILRIDHAGIYRYIFSAGAALALVGRLFAVAPEGVSLRVRRLCRMELWSAVLFCAAVFCMFYPRMGRTDWIAFTLAGGFLQLYASIAVPRALAKERAEGDENVKK